MPFVTKVVNPKTKIVFYSYIILLLFPIVINSKDHIFVTEKQYTSDYKKTYCFCSAKFDKTSASKYYINGDVYNTKIKPILDKPGIYKRSYDGEPEKFVQAQTFDIGEFDIGYNDEENTKFPIINCQYQGNFDETPKRDAAKTKELNREYYVESKIHHLCMDLLKSKKKILIL